MDRVFLGLLFAIGLVVVSIPTSNAASNTHCVWHGTAPLCMPDCPAAKKKIPGTEKKCGDSKIACCLWGEKYVCCPKDWEGTAANAMAIAKEDSLIPGKASV